MKDFKGLANLVTHIQKGELALYKNVQNQVRQCSVGVIFRFNPSKSIPRLPILNNSPLLTPYPFSAFNEYLTEAVNLNQQTQTSLIDLLFIQRAINENDSHSGQIGFPGGKLDGTENDLEGCIREVQEEIGLDLTNQESFAYLGKLPKNFFTYYRKGLRTMLSVNVFFMKDPNTTLVLSPSEVASTFWTPLDYLIHPSTENIQIYQQHATHINFIYKNDGLWYSKILKEIFKNFKKIELPCFRMPNDEILYGLTHTVVIHLLSLMAHGEQNVDPNLLGMISSIKTTKAHYEKDILGIKSVLAEQIYYRQRIKQFLMN